MALVEGGGTVTTTHEGPVKAARERKPAPAGTTRLQQFVAEPSDVPEPVAPTPTDGTALSAGTAAAALAASYGAGGTPPVPENSTAWALGEGYAIARGEEPTATREAVQTPAKQEEEARTYRARVAKEMSWDDYLGLTDRARAAVDFNTMLVQARQKDLRSDYEPTDQQREVYDRTVGRMFGKEGVSETFAPETVAMLNDINFEATDQRRFDDLDDFLGLSAALTAKDIDKIGKLKPPDPVIGGGTGAAMDQSLGGLVQADVPNETLSQVATTLAAGTAQMQQAMTRGNQVLENWKQVAAGARNESVGFYGGIANKVAAPDIRVGGSNDSYFAMAYDTLADASNGPEVVELIRKDLGDKDFKKFLAYADTKTQYSLDQSVGLGSDPAVQYRSPDEFRQVLGLKGSGETDGAG
jgi:hypothetical protein